MARFIGQDRRQEIIKEPLTFTRLERLVGAAPTFINLLSGDVMVVSNVSTTRNETACAIAGPKLGPVFGNVVILDPDKELA